MEDLKQDITHFDLNRPHMRVTGEKGIVTIIQNGFIYTYTIPDIRHANIGGKIIGKIDMLKPAATALGHKFCDICGITFGMSEGLQEHLYKVHRDTLLVSMIQNNPDELRLGELPSEEQLKTEATRIVTGQEAEEAIDKQNQKLKHPAVKAFVENKAKKKGAYREPLKG